MKKFGLASLALATLYLAPHAIAAPVYIALGDSITFGETDLRYIPSFGDRGYVGFFADTLDARNGSAPRPIVINLAIDGETAESFMDGTGRTPPVVGRTDIPLAQQNLNYAASPTTPQGSRLATRVAEQQAAGNTINTISITLGFNELGALTALPTATALSMIDPTLAAYRNNYTNVLTQIRSLAPTADLYLLNYFNPCSADPAVNTADAVFAVGGPLLNAIIRDLAIQFGAFYVDTFTPFVGNEAAYTFIDEFPAGSITPPPYSAFDNGIAPIGNVHPNDTGYRVIAAQLASAQRVPEPSSFALFWPGRCACLGVHDAAQNESAPLRITRPEIFVRDFFSLLPIGLALLGAKSPVRIQEVVDERRRHDADQLMELRWSIRERSRQDEKRRVAHGQRGERHDVELEPAHRHRITLLTPAKSPDVVQQKIGENRYLDGDRRGDILVHSCHQKQREHAEIDDHAGSAHQQELDQHCRTAKAQPRDVQDELGDIA